MKWTTKKVRKELPDVPVQFPDGHTTIALCIRYIHPQYPASYSVLAIPVHGTELMSGLVPYARIADVLNSGDFLMLPATAPPPSTVGVL